MHVVLLCSEGSRGGEKQSSASLYAARCQPHLTSPLPHPFTPLPPPPSQQQPDGSLHVYDSVGHADRTDAPTKIVPVCDTRDPRRGFEGQVLPVLRRDKRGAKHVAGAATKGTFAAEGGAEVEVEVKAGGLPADYDGWLQYTAVNASKLGLQGGFDSFTNTMSVPDVPKKRAQVLYFFPGLQNIDW